MSAFKHVLVASDGSAPADRAVALALRVAGGARITALMVLPDYGAKDYIMAAVAGRPDEHELRDALMRHGRSRLDRQLASHGAAAEAIARRVVLGDRPDELILQTARSESCDLIVMGSHGMGTLIAPLLGSQVTRVLSHASIPVLVATGE